MCTKNIVIERTRDLIYLKFVATDFFPKIISSSAGKKTPLIQCNPCYSAVSALLTNPLSDCSNYSPLLPHPLPHSGSICTSLVSSGQTLYQAAPLHCCSTLLEFSREFRRNACLEEAEQQAEASVDVPYPPLQMVNSVALCLFSLSLWANM